MGAVIVHYQIDCLVEWQSSLIPDLFEELSCGYLGRRLMQLVDEATRHAVADAAKHGDTRESRTWNSDFDISTLGHVGRGWLGPGVHRGLIHVAERDLLLNQLRQVNYKRFSVLQPRRGLEMLVPIACTP